MIKKETYHLFFILVIFMAACIETDIYLPAFADMMDHFQVSEEAIQRLLTWNFVGICLSGPLYGPISDAYGRKGPLLVALGLFLLGSVMTVVTDSFEAMLWGRLLQGLGSGGCFTLGTAIIFDAFEGERSVTAISQINSIAPFIMAAAPMVGGYLNHAFGFRSNFIAIAICVMLSLLLSLFFFKETHTKEKRTLIQASKLFGDFKRACTSWPFWQLTFVVSLLNAGYLAFLSTIAVLFVVSFGVSKGDFPYYQGAILLSWLVASLSCTKALKTLGLFRLKVAGTSMVIVGGIAFALGAKFAPSNPLLHTLAMTLFTFGVNWTQGLYFPECMQILPEIKGISASLLTSTRLLITALVIDIASRCYDGTIFPILMVTVAISVASLALIMSYETKKMAI